MKNLTHIILVLCLVFSLSCSSSPKQSGPDKGKKIVNVIPPAKEQRQQGNYFKLQQPQPVTLSKGGVVLPKPQIKSYDISQSIISNSPVSKLEKEENTLPVSLVSVSEGGTLPEEKKDSFWSDVLWYSFFWFTFVAFVVIGYRAWKKYKISKENPFKEPPKQLNLNL